MTPADLVEIERITQLKHRYQRCLDLKRWDEIAECFTADAVASYSAGKYAFEGRQDEYALVDGAWRIARTGYERVFEEILPRQGWQLTASLWGTGGRSTLEPPAGREALNGVRRAGPARGRRARG